jgi:hypothetical protein
MINENFIYLGIAIGFLGQLSYLIDTIKGKTKPNKVTWAVWAFAPLIAFWATIRQGVGVQSLLTFMVGFGPLVILIASFASKKAYWKTTKLDLICGGLAIIGLILWKITGTGNLAIFFSIIADGLAAIPTIIKSYKQPETENSNGYLGTTVAALITLLTIKIWSFEQYAFAAYIFAMNTFILILLKPRLGKKILSSH